MNTYKVSPVSSKVKTVSTEQPRAAAIFLISCAVRLSRFSLRTSVESKISRREANSLIVKPLRLAIILIFSDSVISIIDIPHQLSYHDSNRGDSPFVGRYPQNTRLNRLELLALAVRYYFVYRQHDRNHRQYPVNILKHSHHITSSQREDLPPQGFTPLPLFLFYL